MNKLKFLIDARGIQEGFKQHKHRGIGYYAKNLLQRLPKYSDDFEFSYLVNKDLPFDLTQENKALKLLEHHTHGRITSITKFFEPQLTLPRTIRSGNYAAVHYLAHEDAALSTPAPYIITIPDLIPLAVCHLYDSVQKIKRTLLNLFIKQIIAKSAAIITISDHSKKDIIKYFAVPEEKIATIYLAAEESYYKQYSTTEIEEVRRKYNLPSDFLFYVGGIDPRKNIKNMFKTLVILSQKRKPMLPLAFAGSISQQSEYREVLAIVKDLKLNDKIKFLGFVPEHDLPKLFTAAKMFIFPSLYEGFGLPVLQSMAAGTPVVTSRFSSIPEVAGDAVLYVDVSNPEAIADGICALLDNSTLAQEKIALGKIQARKFSWEQTVKQTVEVYRRMALKHKNSGEVNCRAALQ